MTALGYPCGAVIGARGAGLLIDIIRGLENAAKRRAALCLPNVGILSGNSRLTKRFACQLTFSFYLAEMFCQIVHISVNDDQQVGRTDVTQMPGQRRPMCDNRRTTIFKLKGKPGDD